MKYGPVAFVDHVSSGSWGVPCRAHVCRATVHRACREISVMTASVQDGEDFIGYYESMYAQLLDSFPPPVK